MDTEHDKTTAVGRPRSQKAYEAVMKAALDLLKSAGYPSLTMEKIAKEAGVGKPTLYRWWPGVPFIVMEALKLHADTEIGLPDSGHLKSDVLEYLKRTFRSLIEGKDEIVCSLMAEAQFNPEFAAAFRDNFIFSRRAALIRLLERGQQRGELPRDADLELIADLCYGPMWYRLLNRHSTLEDPFVDNLVSYLFDSPCPKN
ncbi:MULTISPECIES: TetR/AcrR family transcriptional regulator [unclassified Paenibacillus]|uniref:TetR/AcrR family transcriptional regulator n=1 Tax=unclassified Paenibacillus TaxID=185978 RepID=UPI000CF9EA19|nr:MULTISPECIES: TetR/AcrR family transcriptional regulator [unclassified Paenibacillus]PQP90004.1 TetR family transcriptional regulator [Paenibacillus sp. AR247]